MMLHLVKEGVPKQLIQLKHHVQHKGSLTDGSTDLWRTLKVWIDVISKSPDILNGTEFLIVTTAIAPDGTAASYLKKNDNRDVDSAYEKLKMFAQNQKTPLIKNIMSLF